MSLLCPRWRVEEISILIGSYVPLRHCGVTLLGIFHRVFSDRVGILLPRQRNLSQPIVFGLIVPNVTPKITCARAHLKSVTCSKATSSLDIIQAYNQYDFGQFGIIPLSQALVCQKIKIFIKSLERTQSSWVVIVPGMCNVRYLLFEILDKWKYYDPVCDHFKSVPLRHALSTMYNNFCPVPVPQNDK